MFDAITNILIHLAILLFIFYRWLYFKFPKKKQLTENDRQDICWIEISDVTRLKKKHTRDGRNKCIGKRPYNDKGEKLMMYLDKDCINCPYRNPFIVH